MKNLNNIKRKTKQGGATSVLISVLFDLNRSTIANWNSNLVQPTLGVIDELADFLEVPNSDLIVSIERKQTGLAKATQAEFKRLLKSGIPHKIESQDKNGNKIEINNPELVEAIRDFVTKYKAKTRK